MTTILQPEQTPILQEQKPITNILTTSQSLDTQAEIFENLPSEQLKRSAAELAAENVRKRKEREKAKRETAAAAEEAANPKHPLEVNMITRDYIKEQNTKKLETLANLNEQLKKEREQEVAVPGMINTGRPTSQAAVQKILAQLNINLDVQLTRSDTKNLLATLLTCNESQLIALLDNSKTPVVIKTVIKRLLDDAKVGSMENINSLWDRIFGKGGLAVDSVSATSGALPGVIPGQPVSREAYVIIRETIFGNK